MHAQPTFLQDSSVVKLNFVVSVMPLSCRMTKFKIQPKFSFSNTEVIHCFVDLSSTTAKNTLLFLLTLCE